VVVLSLLHNEHLRTIHGLKHLIKRYYMNLIQY
jgi:hypothetical protein